MLPSIGPKSLTRNVRQRLPPDLLLLECHLQRRPRHLVYLASVHLAKFTPPSHEEMSVEGFPLRARLREHVLLAARVMDKNVANGFIISAGE